MTKEPSTVPAPSEPVPTSIGTELRRHIRILIPVLVVVAVNVVLTVAEAVFPSLKDHEWWGTLNWAIGLVDVLGLLAYGLTFVVVVFLQDLVRQLTCTRQFDAGSTHDQYDDVLPAATPKR